jgi:hypothetical protein
VTWIAWLSLTSRLRTCCSNSSSSSSRQQQGLLPQACQQCKESCALQVQLLVKVCNQQQLCVLACRSSSHNSGRQQSLQRLLLLLTWQHWM